MQSAIAEKDTSELGSHHPCTQSLEKVSLNNSKSSNNQSNNIQRLKLDRLHNSTWTQATTQNIVLQKSWEKAQKYFLKLDSSFKARFKAGPPLEAILVIFGRRALIFFCLKGLGKKWKMTPLLCACAVVITLETQKCRKRAPRSVEFNFFNNCDRHKRFSQNERRRADLQNIASDFLIFA